MKKLMIIALGMMLLACDKADKPASSADAPAPSAALATDASAQTRAPLSDLDKMLVGCYTFGYNAHGKPDHAVLKVSADQNALVMQMKNEDKQKLWDTPESLQVLPASSDGFEFFKVNALNINAADVLAVAAREDKVMALGYVRPELKQLGALDSEFIINVAGAVNTVYKVPCDDVPMDLTVPS